jgi:beta-lactamase class A
MVDRRSFLKGLGAGLVGLAGLVSSEADARGSKRRRRSVSRKPSRSQTIDSLIKTSLDETYAQDGNKDLEDKIEAFVGRLRSKKVLKRDDETSIYVYDIKKNYVPCSINIDNQRMAASLIKPYVMAAAFDKLKRTRKGFSGKIKRDIELMIKHSNNPATNRVIDYVGGVSAVQSYINGTRLFSETKVVETIPKNERTYKNKTSAHDLNILLNQIYRGNLVSKKASSSMLKILDGYTTSRIEKVYGKRANIAGFAGKTGFVYGLNGESTIVDYKFKNGQVRPFIFTAMVENKKGPGTSGRKRDPLWGKTRSKVIRGIFDIVAEHYRSELSERYRARDSNRLRRIDEKIAHFERNKDVLVRRGKKYEGLIKAAAKKHGLEYEDLYSLIAAESSFRPSARSPTGPMGIMQFTRNAARDRGLRVNWKVDDRLNPSKAIDAGAKHLARWYNNFKDTTNNNRYIARDNAIAAYNSGLRGLKNLLDSEEEISFWHVKGNTQENKDYVAKILAARKVFFGID